MSGRSNLAASLATVAIAALGGPIILTRTALEEVVKHAQSLYDQNDESRQISRRVSEAVKAWAVSENLAKDVDLGLELAAETVARFGLSTDRLAELSFEAAAAAGAVVAAARADDPKWGTEDHYAVAVRAIGVTYEALIAQLRANEGTAVALFLTLRKSIEDYATGIEHRLKALTVTSGDLSDALTGVGTVADIASYLRARIRDWDTSVWHHDRKASAVERPLKVQEKSGLPVDGRLLSCEEALAAARMLVVLGGPGAGKTWLARHYARQAAKAALAQLEEGASPDEVELPLLTTWEHWVQSAGDTDQSLVTSSFASGLGHSNVGDSDTSARIKRTFVRSRARVLLVIDSLDEAADVVAQGPRLRELLGLPPSWRIVVTSRPAAWRAAYRGGGDSRMRVVELADLSFPEEVETFVRDWFRETGDPGRGDSLIKQIQGRPEVARAAVVPLMLAFYCLLAEDAREMSRPLPARRRELYRRLTLRLLRGGWTGNHAGPDTAPGWDYCKELLRNWAWTAVGDRNNAAGLGVWDDSFIQPADVRQTERRAIDHIAPKIAEDDEGNITRRFVHRTFLEHFVAEHIATLDTRTAADLLLPHLWFDPDWEIAAPAAIVSHNQQQKGALLENLLSRVPRHATDPARQVAQSELDRLLLTIAQESEPGEWSQEHQDLLHQCRVDNATSRPDLVAGSAHWAYSNPNVCTVVLGALAAADKPWGLALLAEALPSLATTEAAKAQARGAVLQALTVSEDSEDFVSLVEVLSVLGPTDSEKAQARRVVLQGLSTTKDPRSRGNFVDALLLLNPTDGDRTPARRLVLQSMITSENSMFVLEIAEKLLALDPTNGERTEARMAVLRTMRTGNDPSHPEKAAKVLSTLAFTDDESAETLMAVLPELTNSAFLWPANLKKVLSTLASTDSAKAQTRKAVLQALSAPEGARNAASLVETLLALSPTVEEQAQARGTLLHALSAADEHHVFALARGLSALSPTAEEQAHVRAAVVQDLKPEHTPFGTYARVSTLLALMPTDRERAQARSSVLQALDAPRQHGAPILVRALLTLDPSDEERAQARRSALEALTMTKDAENHDHKMKALLALSPTVDEQAQVRGALLKVLAAADQQLVLSIAETLPALSPTREEQGQARTALLKVLAAADRQLVLSIAEALPALSPTREEQARARATVLSALTSTDDLRDAGALTAILLILTPTKEEQAEARAAVLQALATTDEPWKFSTLTTALSSQLLTADERTQLRMELLRALARSDDPKFILFLVEALRSTSAIESWMEWLTGDQ